MKRFVTVLAGFLASFWSLRSGTAFAQETGDYRSAAEPETGATSQRGLRTDGTAWEDATAAPDGSEAISISHVVTVDVSVTVTGYVEVVVDDGQLAVAEESGGADLR
jgi:hypothetical protein